jgi:SAM-dependent methyltransferase
MSPGFDVDRCFSVPLRDLGEVRTGMEGILIPESEIGRAPVGVTEQFLEDAEFYHERFTNVAYFTSLISRALDGIELPEGDLRILDLGSGSGNSVWPCLDLLPDCNIVAVDISPELLLILRDHVEAEPTARGRVTPVCMSATSPLFAPDSFHLAIGAAILHHLIDPGAAVEAVGQALEPGGSAIFFEPLESGHGLLRLAYTQIIDQQDRRGRGSWWKRHEASVEEKLAFEVLQSMVAELELRTGSDKSDPIYRDVDDKWLFTRSGLEEYAERGGFSDVRIDPLSGAADPLAEQTRTILRLAKGLEPEALPDWAWETLASFDSAFSDELKRDLQMAGCVTYTK